MKRVVILAGCVLLALWSLAPLVWLVLVGLLPPVDLGDHPPNLDPAHFSVVRYVELLGDPIFQRSVLNSAIVAGCTTVACLLVGSIGGYSLARLPVPGKRLFIGGALATQMVPGIILVIPVFLIMRGLGLTDTLLALVTVYTAFLMPYALWLLRNFFAEVPIQLEAAARMDGCTRVGALFRIVMPAAAPGMAATAIFVFISCWNEFLFALVLSNQDAKTVTVRLSEVQGQIYGQQDFAILANAAGIAVVPVVLAVIFLN